MFSTFETHGLLAQLEERRAEAESRKDELYGSGRKEISIRARPEGKYDYSCASSAGASSCRAACADSKCANAREECRRDGQCNGIAFVTSTGAEWSDVADLTGAVAVFQSYVVGTKNIALQEDKPFLRFILVALSAKCREIVRIWTMHSKNIFRKLLTCIRGSICSSLYL